jgi:hypothetical protein
LGNFFDLFLETKSGHADGKLELGVKWFIKRSWAARIFQAWPSSQSLEPEKKYLNFEGGKMAAKHRRSTGKVA